jgi:hypothetical protein
MKWVDGREFTKPDGLLFKGSRKVRTVATLDVYEDPADVYRVRVPGGGSVGVSAAPVYGNVTLSAFAPGATSLRDAKRRVGRSAHGGHATEHLRIANTSSRARVFFVGVQPAGHKRLDAGYTLRVAR